jgi:shikimate kinase
MPPDPIPPPAPITPPAPGHGVGPPPRNILLIGLRGAGKSVTGHLLASNLGRQFTDVDEVTCSLLNCRSVAEAWQTRGIAAFRLAETAALRRILEVPNQVIACGGGTPTAPGAAEVIRAAQRAGAAVVVYLRAPADVLRMRLAGSPPAVESRPAIYGTDPLAEIDTLLAHRDPLYLALADHIIETSRLTPDKVAEAIALLI